MKAKNELPECPVAVCVQMVSSKWKLLILRNLLVRPWRFNELQKSIDGISPKVLTDSLRAMEADGLVNRTSYGGSLPHVEYSLTEVGESLRPVLDAMREWGENHKARKLEQEGMNHGAAGDDQRKAIDPEVSGQKC